MKNYDKIFKEIEKKVVKTKEQHIYFITKGLDGEIQLLGEKDSKKYQSFDEAEEEIKADSLEKGIEPLFLRIEIVDNKF